MKSFKSVFCLLLLSVIVLFSGCGTPFEPITFVTGNLDLIYHNTVNAEFAESLSKSAATKAEATRNNYINNTVADIFAAYHRENPPQELTEKLTATVNLLYNSAKYEVTTAEATENGYTVKVTAYPLLTYQTVINDADGSLAAATQGQYTMGMTETEITDAALKAFCDTLNNALSTPTYGEPIDVTLQIEKGNDGYYTINSDDFTHLEQIILYNNIQ